MTAWPKYLSYISMVQVRLHPCLYASPMHAGGSLVNFRNPQMLEWDRIHLRLIFDIDLQVGEVLSKVHCVRDVI